MVTADSVKAKLQGLIDTANAATGNADADLTAAVNALAAGFGQGGGGVAVGLIEGTEAEITDETAPGLTAIRPYGFIYDAYVKNITRVNHTTLENVMQRAFYGNTGITEFFAPNITDLGSNALRGCSALTELAFPKLKTASISAFEGCSSLKRADFSVLTKIEDWSFYGTSALEALIIRNPDTVCGLHAVRCFESSAIANGTGYVYVPSALVDSYKAATNWSVYADQIRAIEDYPNITGVSA
jgi:hypothetical protein